MCGVANQWFQLVSHVQLFATPWTATRQASLSFTVSQSLLRLMSIELVMPSNHLILCCPLLLLPWIFPSIRAFCNELAHCIMWAKVLKLQLQHQSLQWIFKVDILSDCLVWPPCSPRDSQKSSLASQFERINSLALSHLYGPVLTAVLDYWKNHNFDYTDLCWQSDVSAFYTYTCTHTYMYINAYVHIYVYILYMYICVCIY